MKKSIFWLLLLPLSPLWAQNESLETSSTDESSIPLLENIQELPSSLLTQGEIVMVARAEPNSNLKEKDPIIAWILCFPLGMTGVHRVYLGANPKIMAWYILSVGGVFGIIPMIDWIFLLKSIQKNDISPYVGNDKWIMWL